jgi:hypothetical protein
VEAFVKAEVLDEWLQAAGCRLTDEQFHPKLKRQSLPIAEFHLDQ